MKKVEELQARKRAEVILKVQSRQISATEAAKELGVSRKTYYEWEQRGLKALMDALQDRPPGRPAIPRNPEEEVLKKKVGQLEQELEITRAAMEIREILRDLDEDEMPQSLKNVKRKKKRKMKRQRR